ncbi:hypothetical protein ES705_32882 [subsurface metagenome]
MEPELTLEETIKMLEEFQKMIPTLIFLMKLSQLEIAQVEAHVDVHQDDVVEAVDAQGHPEIRQNSY